MAEDFYSSNAEWYPALVAAWKDDSASVIRDLVGRLDGGDVVDIASGVGSYLPVLRELGAGRIFAVEPSASMRAGLMTTIAADPDLMRRATIVPAAFPDAVTQLPETWSAAVMLNAIGHLDDADRSTLWEVLEDRLVAGGRFVVSLQPPERVEQVPWTDFGEITVGENMIRTRGKADPLGETRVFWTMEWTRLDASGDTITTSTATHPWRVLTRADLATEAARHGLVSVDGPDDVPVFAFERR